MSTDTAARDAERLRAVALARGEGEYDVFVAAWHAWHGDAPPADHLEADFGGYLRSQAVPPYVRHFVRAWLEEHPEVERQRAAERRALRRARLLALALIGLAVAAAMLAGALL